MRQDGEPYRLVVEAKASLFPRDAREAIWQLRNYLAHLDNVSYPAVPLLMAESISPGARELLRDERVGYFDSSGSLFIAAKGLYLRVDKPASRKQSRSLNNLFAGRRAQVLHAVWVTKPDWFGVHEIAERAGVSPATASETLIALERRDWVEVRGAGPSKERRLTNSRALLDAWSSFQSSVKPKVVQHYYVRSVELPDLQRQLDHACEIEGVPYELTGISAGQIHAPYLSSVSQVSCRVSESRRMHAVLDAIGARPVREGWNLGVHELKSDDELRFRQRIDDLWVADPLQTYLDLLQSGGRAKELAHHLRAEKLDA
ncbi:MULTISPECIES: helix-turn-helix domain-containing protein [Microvirga]|uniref:Helix-turn-helix domain-containing protein n=1 Tax=Microvirga arabica TaxID=1128671 RepID=A0ABV6Y7C2_9HYPH|nr:helix-turn-helix domain-containing protein [Microvirga sp. Mcv34]